ncbi:MAG: cell division ATP-binding protein FtsE [Candidatus Tectomicrobia bacterium]|nr:cell division ATP-binding protein FtsE [Candidatus Tectomicrobia bacterium]
MIRVFDVYKTYDKHTSALAALSLHVDQGEMVFLTGPSGAGKTTLLRLLYGAERPERGQIIVNGRNIARLQRRHLPELRRSLGLVFQDFKLLPDRTAFDNIAFALRAVGAPSREIRQRVTRLLYHVGLSHQRDVPARRLSGGEQQRVAIARALVNTPQLVLADEPTGNLDPEMTREIMQLFVQMHQHGTTVLIATHDQTLLSHTDYRVLTLRSGRLVGR